MTIVFMIDTRPPRDVLTRSKREVPIKVRLEYAPVLSIVWWHRRRRSVSGRSHFHSLGADDAFPYSNGGMWYFCFEPSRGSSLTTWTCHEQLPPLNHPSRNFRHSWISKGLALLLSRVLQRSREAPLQDPPRQDQTTGNTKLSPSLRDDPFPSLPLRTF
ncbi:hypothetical protein CCHR01_07314 [Colletotrichum chrysophilum]|uniref:Uncharacterized protein n=1 Tax=Colletotrichum chrysophilum TaxID=1836956 RepID=A0AAD9AL18_9PEZI|nr:hypothetical protein CCHR01_07314 [Colletotrichum chrysophilum]